jgi:hypothetical protein
MCITDFRSSFMGETPVKTVRVVGYLPAKSKKVEYFLAEEHPHLRPEGKLVLDECIVLEDDGLDRVTIPEMYETLLRLDRAFRGGGIEKILVAFLAAGIAIGERRSRRRHDRTA